MFKNKWPARTHGEIGAQIYTCMHCTHSATRKGGPAKPLLRCEGLFYNITSKEVGGPMDGEGFIDS